MARLLAAVQDWADDPPSPATAGSNERSGAAAPCTWCPLCQAVERLRTTDPEVRAHAMSAATSLLSAAASALEAVAAHRGATGGATGTGPEPG